MKNIIIFTIILLLGCAYAYANEEIEGFETVSAPTIDIESLRPSQDDLDRVSRLSEKYINGSISENELQELEKTGGDISELDKYKVQVQERMSTNQENNIITGTGNSNAQVDLLEESTSDEKQQNNINIIYFVLFLTVINTLGLVYVCIRKK